MTLWNDLDAACSQIKHAPESVDLDHIRGLLRRSQALCSAVQGMIPPEMKVDLRIDVEDLVLAQEALGSYDD